MNNTDTLFAYIQKTQPTVVFWDIGKVLVNVDFQTENKKTAEHFKIDYQELKNFIKSYFHHYILGEISNKDVDRMFQENFGISESITTFQKHIYDQTICLNDELLSLISTYTGPQQMSIISNIFPDTLEDLRQRGILEQFVQPIFSCEVGMAKPDQDIYYYALTQFQDVTPQQCLFVDDKNTNLLTAREVGMDTFRYTKYIGI